ncbi:unnamed protein product, partial [Ectocarpus sp. 6 AP-2014]
LSSCCCVAAGNLAAPPTRLALDKDIVKSEAHPRPMWRRTIVMALAACYSRCSGFMNFSKGVARVSSSLRLGDSRAKCSSHGTTIRGAAAVAAISGRCLGVRGGANRRLHATVPAAETPTSDTPAEKEASPVVSSLQAWMRKENMDCFIVPSDDPH